MSDKPNTDSAGNPISAGAPTMTAAEKAAAVSGEPAKSIRDLPVVKEGDAPAPVTDDTEVDINDFLEVSGKVVKDLTEKDKKVEKTPEKATKETLELTPAAKDKEAKEGRREVPTQAKKKEEQVDARDYEGIEETLKPAFKRMSNESFDTLKPVALEAVKLRKELIDTKKKVEDLEKGIVKVPDSYYEHELGYTLTPDYSDAVQAMMLGQRIANHWEKQAAKLEDPDNDGTYTKLVKDDNGNIVESEPLKADKSSPATVAGYVRGAHAQLMQVRSKAQTIAERYSEKHSEAVKNLRDFEATSFKVFEGNKQFETLVNDTITKTLPPAFHNSPLAPLVGKLLLVTAQLGERVKELAGGKAADTKTATNGHKKEEETTRRQPNLNDTSGGDAGGKAGDEVTFDDFKRVKGGY